MPNPDGYSSDGTHNDWIPVLTEVITPGEADQATPQPPRASTRVMPLPPQPAAGMPATGIHGSHATGAPAAGVPATGSPAAGVPATLHLSEEEWEQLEQKLTERILRQLQGRIDFVLEQRIRDSLADVLQLAMIGLTKDIKHGLQHTLEDVIGRAVAQEITRLQTGKK